ncbi:hypothetical protein BGZ94_003117, partial [Podila epigama]
MDNQSARTLAASFVVLATATVVVYTLLQSGTETHTKSSTRRSQKNQKNRKGSKNLDSGPQYVTGLVNIGNTCFMNSVLQLYLEGRKALGHVEDSVTMALYETIELLTRIHRRPTSRRPIKMVNIIKSKAAQVLTSQQQDAQELFQIISSLLSEEREKMDHARTVSLLDGMTVSEVLRRPKLDHRQSSGSLVMSTSLSLLSTPSNNGKGDSLQSPTGGHQDRMNMGETNEKQGHGEGDDDGDDDVMATEDTAKMTGSLLVSKAEQEKYNRAKSPFMGLLASRVSCVDCGYT